MIYITIANKILEANEEIIRVVDNRKCNDKPPLRKDLLYVAELQGKIKAWQEVLVAIATGMFDLNGQIAS